MVRILVSYGSLALEGACGFNKVHSYVCTTHAPVLSVQHLQNETILWLATAVHQQTFKVSEHVDQHSQMRCVSQHFTFFSFPLNI